MDVSSCLSSCYRWIWLAVALTTGCASHTAVIGRDGGAGHDAGIGRHAGVERDTGLAAVKIAEQMVGKPYRYGGASPKGFDCSGLVHYSFGKAGQSVPRETRRLYDMARPVDMSKLKPGDLLFFRIDGKISHVALYLDKDRFVHSPSSGKSVSYGTLSNPYWKTRLVKAGRL